MGKKEGLWVRARERGGWGKLENGWNDCVVTRDLCVFYKNDCVDFSKHREKRGGGYEEEVGVRGSLRMRREMLRLRRERAGI